MKSILSIGNSFSQDAHKWLWNMCSAGEKDVFAKNILIPGCSLQTHWQEWSKKSEEYFFEHNGEYIDKTSLAAALTEKEWDIITFQQASHFSGRPQTYQPYLKNLSDLAKQKHPNALQYIQKTWAYEIDSEHFAFSDYNRDQGEMYRRLTDAYEMAAQSINAQLIPVGDVIQYLRENTDEFNYSKGGISLCRDGFHLSLDYGRYAAAATWFVTLFDGDIKNNTFIPEVDGVKANEKLLNIIKNAVLTVCKEECNV